MCTIPSTLGSVPAAMQPEAIHAFATVLRQKIDTLRQIALTDGNEHYIEELVSVDHIFKAIYRLDEFNVKVEFVYNRYQGKRVEIQSAKYKALLFSAAVGRIQAVTATSFNQQVYDLLQPWSHTLLPNAGEGYFVLGNTKNAPNLQNPVVIARTSIAYVIENPPAVEIIALALESFIQSVRAFKPALEQFIANEGANATTSTTQAPNKKQQRQKPDQLVNNLGQLARFISTSKTANPADSEHANYACKYRRQFFNLELGWPSWSLRSIQVKQGNNHQALKLAFSGVPFDFIPMFAVWFSYQWLPWLQTHENVLPPNGTFQIGPDPLGMGVRSYNDAFAGTYASVAELKINWQDEGDIRQALEAFNTSIYKVFALANSGDGQVLATTTS